MGNVEQGSGGGRVRIGDAERERAITQLGEHFSAGRIDVHEYDERCASLSAARFHSDLVAVFTDLPDPKPVLPAPQPVKRPASRFPAPMIAVFAVVAALALTIVLKLPPLIVLLGAAGICLLVVWRPRNGTK